MKLITHHSKKLNKTFVCRQFDPVLQKNKADALLHKLYPKIDYTDLWIINEMTDYINNLTLTKDDVWADLGSNIAAFAVTIYDKVKKIYGVEPFQENIDIIKKQLDFNKITNYELTEKAVMNESGFMNLFIHIDNACHTLIKKNQHTRDIIQIPVISFNEWIEQRPDINKVKMDIEGAEYQVILGYDKWNRFDEFYFEWHQRLNKDKLNIKFKEVLNYLNYFFETVSDNGMWMGTTMVHCENPKTNVDVSDIKLNKITKLF